MIMFFDKLNGHILDYNKQVAKKLNNVLVEMEIEKKT